MSIYEFAASDADLIKLPRKVQVYTYIYKYNFYFIIPAQPSIHVQSFTFPLQKKNLKCIYLL
jgi:hypothetical protein